jgi:U3 small nucleolar RNA-associated protein 4
MLNVGQNLDDGLTSLMNKKRRPSEFEDDGTSKRIKGASSGAGSRLPASQRAPGYAGSIKITSQDGQSEAVALRSDNDEDGDVAMEDDNDDADGLQLTRLRSEDGAGIVPAQYERKFWGSFKYRPILGMVPLENEGGKGEDVLEVVIVERPADEGRGRAAGR